MFEPFSRQPLSGIAVVRPVLKARGRAGGKNGVLQCRSVGAALVAVRLDHDRQAGRGECSRERRVPHAGGAARRPRRLTAPGRDGERVYRALDDMDCRRIAADGRQGGERASCLRAVGSAPARRGKLPVCGQGFEADRDQAAVRRRVEGEGRRALRPVGEVAQAEAPVLSFCLAR